MPLGIDATLRYRLNNWSRPLHLSELLMRLLADVEHVGSGRPGERRVLTADLLAMLEEPDLGNAVHAELDRLAGSTELADRLEELASG